MAIDPKLIDQLVGEYKSPEQIIGENGLLKELTKAVLVNNQIGFLPSMTVPSISTFRILRRNSGPCSTFCSTLHRPATHSFCQEHRCVDEVGGGAQSFAYWLLRCLPRSAGSRREGLLADGVAAVR